MSDYVLKRKKSKIYRELNTILTVMGREITVFLKSPGLLL